MDDFRFLSYHLHTDSSCSSLVITDENGTMRRPRARSLRWLTLSLSLPPSIHCVYPLYAIMAHIFSLSFSRLSFRNLTFTLTHTYTSPERSPREILMDLDATHNIFKNKYPKAKEEMEERLQVCVFVSRQHVHYLL